MVRARVMLAAVTGGVAAFGATAPVHAAATVPVAVWEMNEPPGAATMVDSSGRGRHGSIGAEVVTGSTYAGATAYRFTFLKPNQPPAHPEHVVRVPDDPGLDPGTRDYAVTVRFRTTHSFGNIIQKGQSGARGGYFKLQAPNGIVQCLFRGAEGSGGAGSGIALNDGQWHVVRCERTATAVTMTVDGVLRGRDRDATGNIANASPLSIGGKLKCDQVVITCDYFAGQIDRVVIEAG